MAPIFDEEKSADDYIADAFEIHESILDLILEFESLPEKYANRPYFYLVQAKELIQFELKMAKRIEDQVNGPS